MAEPAQAKLEPDDPLFPVIDEAYRVFAGPKPDSVDVCTFCCMDEEIERDFFNPPIEQLPLAYLQDWYSAAYDPDSGVAKATWAYLLPRVLEVLASGNDPDRCSLEVTLRRFDTGNPARWNAQQWQVLDTFQRLFLQAQLARSGGLSGTHDLLDEVLCMFGLAGWGVEDLVRQLHESDPKVLAERFYKDWALEHAREYGSIGMTPFWEGEGRTTAWDFYTSRVLHDRMAALALDDATDPVLAEKAYCVAATIAMHADWS